MVEASTKAPDPHPVADLDRVTIEMAGDNVMVRSGATIDLSCTAALVDVVNAAARTGVVVVIDPEEIRCDAALAASGQWASGTPPLPDEVGPAADVEVVSSGVIRVAGRASWWTIDVAAGRFCQSDDPIDCRFVGSEAWTPLVAIWITPRHLSALTAAGTVVTSTRSSAAASSPQRA